MPKASPAVTSSAGKKQSTLLGFFKKPSTAGGPPPSSSSPIQKPHASSKTPLAASSQKNAPPAYGPAMSSPLAAVSSKFKPIEKLAVVLDGEKEAAERDDDLSSLLGPSSPTRPPPSSDAPGEPEASEDVAMDGGDDDFPITTVSVRSLSLCWPGGRMEDAINRRVESTDASRDRSHFLPLYASSRSRPAQSVARPSSSLILKRRMDPL